MDTRLYQIAYVPPESAVTLNEDLSGDADSGSLVTFSAQNADLFAANSATGAFYIDGEYMAYVGKDEAAGTITVRRGSLSTPVTEHKAGSDLRYGVLGGTDDPRELFHVDEVTNPFIVEVGDIEQTLEYKKAEFRISNTSVTMQGVSKERLREAGSIHRPWVFELLDDSGTVVFSGVVDGQSVSYDAGTRQTSFDVLSWLELLDRAPSLPARDIYETKVKKVLDLNEGEDSNVKQFAVVLNDLNLPEEVASSGDVAVFETGDFEIRQQILNKGLFREDGNPPDWPLIQLPSVNEEDVDNVADRFPQDGSYDSEFGEISIEATAGYPPNVNYGLATRNASIIRQLVEAAGGRLDDINAGDSKSFTLPEGFRLEIDVSVTAQAWGNQNGAPYLIAEEERGVITTIVEFTVLGTPNGYRTVLTESLGSNVIFEGTESYEVTDFKDIKYRVRLLGGDEASLLLNLDAGDTVRILDSDIYGYEGEIPLQGSPRLPIYYNGLRLIENMFTIEKVNQTGRPQLGILPYVFDQSAFNSENDLRAGGFIKPEAELPADPLKSIRMIQQKARFLLKENFVSGRVNSENDPIPGYYPSAISRENIFDSATEISTRRIKSWTENVSNEQIKAVVIRPNREYLKGQGISNVDERIGFYFDGIERYETNEGNEFRQSMGVPDGDNVIEIEVPMLPSVETGFIYSGRADDNRAENNPKLREVAKFYFEHFRKAGREVEITFGDNDPEWVGGYWYFKDQGEVIDDLVFVTQETKSVAGSSIDTSLKGRIGVDAGEIVDAAPVAKISGPTDINAADENGDVTVSLSGSNSFSLSGHRLTFTWERKPVGGIYSTVQSGGQNLEDNLTGITNPEEYVYRLTVTDQVTGQTGTAEKSVRVSLADNRPPSQPNSEQFSINTWQQNERAYLSIIPDSLSGIDTVAFRKAVGTNIDSDQSFTLTNVFEASVDSIDTSTNTVVLGGSFKPHFEGAAYVRLLDGNGQQVRFGIDSVTEVGSTTEINLSGSIDSTNYSNASPDNFVIGVDLSTKHTSAIEVRVTGAVQGKTSNVTKTFDFDALAEVDASVYIDQSGAVYVDVQGDEDVAEFDIEYAINGGSSQVVGGSPFGTDQVGLEIVSASTLSDGDEVTVTVTPRNFEGETGRVVQRAVFYNRSQGGSASFDEVSINNGGVISGQNNEFLFRALNGDDTATIDIANVISGAVDVDTLTVTGQSTLSGSVEIGGGLSVQGNTSVVGDLGVTDEFTAGVAFLGPTETDSLLVAGSTTLQGDTTIQGNLTVLGTRFEADVQTVEISDNLAVINSGETGSGVTAGFAGWEVDRGTSNNFRFGFDESLDRFVVGQDGNTQVVATREDSPVEGGLGFYNSSTNRFETTDQVTWDGSILKVGTGSTRISDSDVDTGSILFDNNEQADFSESGRLFWDASAGLYLRSANAPNATTSSPARLLWSGDNFNAAKNLRVTYDFEDRPSLSVTDDVQLDGSLIAQGDVSTNDRFTLRSGAGEPRAFLRTANRFGVENGTVELNIRDKNGDNRGELLRIDTEGSNQVDANLNWNFIRDVAMEGALGVENAVTLNGLIGTSDYAAQQTGWRVLNDGRADFRNIYADELTVQTFTAELTQSLAGSDILTKSAADLSRPYVQGNVGLWIETPPEAQGWIFAVGDVLRLRVVDRSNGGLNVSDVWLEVTNRNSDGGDEQKYLVTELQGPSSYEIRKGARVLDYGTAGDTIIERTVNGPGSPFDRIATWQPDAGGVPSTYTTVSQVGNISDQTDAATGIYTASARLTDDIRIGDLGGSYLEYDGSLTIVTAQHGDLDGAISTIQTDVSDNSADISAVASTQGDQGSAISALQLDVSSNEDGITANSSRISQLDTDLGNVESSLNQRVSAIEDAESYAQNEYVASDGADQYSPKPSVITMEVNDNASWPGGSFGVVVTYWTSNQRARQVYTDSSGASYERITRPTLYPNWKAWTQVADRGYVDGEVQSVQSAVTTIENTLSTNGITGSSSLTSRVDSIETTAGQALSASNDLEAALTGPDFSTVSALRQNVVSNDGEVTSALNAIASLETDTSDLSASLSLLTEAGRHNLYPDENEVYGWPDTFDTTTPNIKADDVGLDDGDYVALSVDVRSQSGTQPARAKLRVNLADGTTEDVTFYSSEGATENWQTFTGVVQLPANTDEFQIHFVNDAGTPQGMERRRVMLVRGQQPVPYDVNTKAQAAFNLAASTDNALVSLDGRVTQNEDDITATATLASQLETDTEDLESALTLVTASGRQNLIPNNGDEVEWSDGNTFITGRIPIADLDLEPGDDVAGSVELQSASGTQGLFFKAIVRDENSTIIQYPTIVNTTDIGESWTRIEGSISIPEGADTIQFYCSNTDQTANARRRRVMLVRGQQPVPYDPNQRAEAAFSLAAQNEGNIASIDGRVTSAESTLTSSVQYNDNGAYTELLAGPSGSEITLSADQININGIARFINSSFTRDFSADGFTNEWSAASGNTIGSRSGGQTEIGSATLQLSSTADMSSTSGGTTGGASIAIPAEIASAWSGRRIEVRLWIKKDANAYTYSGHELAVAYSTADVGNSNWRRFALTNDYRQVSFFYDVPAKNNPGGVDYLGILGDADGGGGHALIDKIEITAQPTTINGSQIETGSITADEITVDDLDAVAASIGGWDISNGAISTTTTDNIQMAFGSTDNGTTWPTSVRGLQVGIDGGNRLWMGAVGSNYEFAVRQNGTYKVRLGSGQNFIDGDLLVNGSVTADAITAGTITANEIAAGTITADEINTNTITADRVNLDDLFAQNIDVTGALTMGTGGEITNASGDFTITEDGISLAGRASFYQEARIDWVGSAGDLAWINGDPDDPDSAMLLSANDGGGTVGVRAERLEMRDVGVARIALHKDGLLHFQTTLDGVPTDSEVRQWIGQGDAALAAVRYNDGNIKLLWMEHRQNGDVRKGTTF